MEGIAIDLGKATEAEIREEISRHQRRAVYVAANPSLGLSAEPQKVIELYEHLTKKLADELTFARGDNPGEKTLQETFEEMTLAAQDSVANKIALRDEEIVRLSGQVKSAREDAKMERDARKRLEKDLAQATETIRGLEDSNAKFAGELEVANATIDTLQADVLKLENVLHEATEPAQTDKADS